MTRTIVKSCHLEKKDWNLRNLIDMLDSIVTPSSVSVNILAQVDNLLSLLHLKSPRKVTHFPTARKKNLYVNQKRNMCNLSPNIFSIHFFVEFRPNDHKFFITPKKWEKSTQETLFCVISFNLIQCIKSEDQYTPFPNKFKTLFHSQTFLPLLGFFILYFRGRSKNVICDKRRKIGLRYRSVSNHCVWSWCP